ncbi:MAG: polysaccharide biosynthesis tyrosine autokinase [Acidobacteriota bacterium]
MSRSDERGGFSAFPGQGGASGGGPMSVDESIDVAKYLTALRRRWPLVAIVCLLAIGFAFVRYALTEKQYRSVVTIQIERKRLSLLALGQAGWLEDWWNLEYYPTQYRLLRSRGMAERVVLNLRLHRDPSFNPRVAGLVGDGEAVELDSAQELAGLAGRVRSGLSVNPIDETQLVDLAYVSTSPELAARIANGYAEAFIEWGIESRSTTVGQASDLLTAQIETLNSEIEEKQKELNSIASSSASSLDPAGEALLERRQTLEQQYNTVVAERIRAESAYRAVSSQSSDSTTSATAARVADLKAELFEMEGEYRSKLSTYRPEWPEMVRLKDQIDEKKTQISSLSRESYRERLDAARSELERARREETSLEDELQKLATSARSQNQEALRFANLRTYIDTRKELLGELVKRQSETEVASRVQTTQGESNVRIVDRAVVPSAAFRPSLQADLSKALMLGLILGVSGVFLLEYFDRSVKTPEQLEALSGLPVLAVIPDIDDVQGGRRYYGRSGAGSRSGSGSYSYAYGQRSSDDGDADRPQRIELLPHFKPRLAVSEAYRSLRTALLLSTTDELRSLSVTSAEPGEGKTATTTNLAVVLAQLGRRVLIVDGDLRRPRMHKVFHTSNRVGLVNFLTAPQADLDSIVFQSPVPNLYMTPSGPIPPNPSELLASGRMREFLAAVKQRFDVVLLDSPPVLPVADAAILGALVDGVVLCARAGILMRDEAKACRERLAFSEVRMVGAVLNRYRAKAGGYNKKYNYYSVYEEPEATASDAA